MAPDKFKGSLTATQAAQAMQRGVLGAAPSAVCKLCPMADGGEGTVDVFLERGAERKTVEVRGPLGAPVEAVYAVDGDTAILEMASASGLGLLERSAYDPIHADTFGTGELIQAALTAGVTRIVIGIGGSATCDGGTGMLRALGVRFLDKYDEDIGGGMVAYEQLDAIDLQGLDKRLARAKIAVAVDVDNPLCGEYGAARTFAAQKGANPAQVGLLDKALERIADVSEGTICADYRERPGAGAAGGLGFALLAFLRATLEPGVQVIARETGLDQLLIGAALCLTGEGKIDEQTLHGKTVFGVGELARARNVPVIAFGGAVDGRTAEKLARRGVDVEPIAPNGTSVEDSIRDAARYVEASARAAIERTVTAR
ncbi:MAG: glycerate kinase [Candidatus Baltobacteraceae bacterium]